MFFITRSVFSCCVPWPKPLKTQIKPPTANRGTVLSSENSPNRPPHLRQLLHNFFGPSNHSNFSCHRISTFCVNWLPSPVWLKKSTFTLKQTIYPLYICSNPIKSFKSDDIEGVLLEFKVVGSARLSTPSTFETKARQRHVIGDREPVAPWLIRSRFTKKTGGEQKVSSRLHRVIIILERQS